MVRDLVMIESATFWKDGPEIETGELTTAEIGTEVFFLPAAAHTEKSGTFTNTQRLLQWHHKAVDPPGDATSDLWFYYHLGRRIKELLKDSTDPMDRPLLDLTWQYPEEGADREPSADAVLREINGTGPDGAALSSYTQLKPDGSTSVRLLDLLRGVRRRGEPVGPAQARRASRAGSHPSGAGRGRPTAGCSTTARPPTPTACRGATRKAYVWWDAEAGKWTGHDVPDFIAGP